MHGQRRGTGSRCLALPARPRPAVPVVVPAVHAQRRSRNGERASLRQAPRCRSCSRPRRWPRSPPRRPHPRTRGSARRSRSRTRSSSTASPCRPRRRTPTTTKIVLTVPKGFSIDSFVPSPGWHRVAAADRLGRQRRVQKVTWTGGNVPTGEDSLFQFLGEPAKTGTYTFQVEQTYSDGSIVDWSGSGVVGRTRRRRSRRRARSAAAARSTADDRRARRRRGRRDPRRDRPRRRRRAGRGSSHEPTGAGLLVAVVAVIALAAAGRRVGARLPDQDRPRRRATILDAPPRQVALTYDEAVEPRFAIISVTDKDGHQVTTGAGQPLAGQPGHADRPAEAASAGGLVPRLLAGDLGRRPSRSRAPSPSRSGPNPGPGAAVRRSRTSPQTATTTPLLIAPLGDVPDRDDRRSACSSLRLAIARPAVRRVAGTRLRAVTVAFAVASALGLIAIPRLPRGGDGDRLAALVLRRSARSCRSCGRPRSGAATSTSGSASRSSASPPGSRSGSTGPSREHRSIAELLAAIGVVAAAAARARRPRPRPATPRRPRRAGSRSRSTGCTSVSGSLWLGGLVGLLVLWWSLPAGQPDRRALGRRAPVLERRLRLGARPARLGGLGGDPAPAAPLGALDDLLRPGDPGQGRAARGGDARSPRSTSLRTKPRLVAARGRPELGARRRSLLRGLVSARRCS